MALDSIDKRVKRLNIDPYIIDTLMPDLVGHDRRPAAFFVYLYLWRQTGQRRKPRSQRSLREISEGTGLSKRAVQDAILRLVGRGLISVLRESITAVPEYTVHRPWERLRRSKQ